MDKIIFQNLKFYGHHGVFAHEKLRGQYFALDLELGCNLQQAGLSDHLGDSVDYGEIYQLVKTIVSKRRFQLLEALGQYICSEILSQFPKITDVRLRLCKPEAPLEGGIIPDEQLEQAFGSAPERHEAASSAAIAPWITGSFGLGGYVGIELHRCRQAGTNSDLAPCSRD